MNFMGMGLQPVGMGLMSTTVSLFTVHQIYSAFHLSGVGK